MTTRTACQRRTAAAVALAALFACTPACTERVVRARGFGAERYSSAEPMQRTGSALDNKQYSESTDSKGRPKRVKKSRWEPRSSGN